MEINICTVNTHSFSSLNISLTYRWDHYTSKGWPYALQCSCQWPDHLAAVIAHEWWDWLLTMSSNTGGGGSVRAPRTKIRQTKPKLQDRALGKVPIHSNHLDGRASQILCPSLLSQQHPNTERSRERWTTFSRNSGSPSHPSYSPGMVGQGCPLKLVTQKHVWKQMDVDHGLVGSGAMGRKTTHPTK